MFELLNDDKHLKVIGVVGSDLEFHSFRCSLHNTFITELNQRSNKNAKNLEDLIAHSFNTITQQSDRFIASIMVSHCFNCGVSAQYLKTFLSRTR